MIPKLETSTCALLTLSMAVVLGLSFPASAELGKNWECLLTCTNLSFQHVPQAFTFQEKIWVVGNGISGTRQIV